MTRTHPIRSTLMLALGVLLLASMLHLLFYAGVAHADTTGPVPIVAVTPAADSAPSPAVVKIATEPVSTAMVVVIALAVALGALGTLLGAVATVAHVIAKRTKNTWDDRIAETIDGMRGAVATLAEIVKQFVPSTGAAQPVTLAVVATPGTEKAVEDVLRRYPSAMPSPTSDVDTSRVRKPEAGAARGVVIAVLAAIGLSLGLGALASCDTLRGRGAAGAGALLDCQADNLKASALELLALAKPALMSAISGDGHVDYTLLKAALAGLKTDLPRCAADAAIAAILTPAPTQPGAAMAAGLEVNATELQAAYATARAELGWPAIRSAGGAP